MERKTSGREMDAETQIFCGAAGLGNPWSRRRFMPLEGVRRPPGRRSRNGAAEVPPDGGPEGRERMTANLMRKVA
ncbi:MAG: hypothetical protein ACE5IM_03020 [Nitrospinota bacterium]